MRKKEPEVIQKMRAELEYRDQIQAESKALAEENKRLERENERLKKELADVINKYDKTRRAMIVKYDILKDLRKLIGEEG